MTSLDRAMGLQAAQQYQSAGVSSTLALTLESSPETYLNKALASNEISQSEAQLLKTLTQDKAQVAADQKLAESELSQQQAAAATAQKQKTSAVSETASAKSLLSSLTAAQQQAIQKSEAPPPPSTVHLTQVAPTGSRGAAAVAFAESALGDEYVYAGAGPSVYDCSGLTMMALQAAGVSVTHNAAAQYDETTHISRSQLQPGDLVFYDYGEGITHVAIYVGNNEVIHAPHTGTVVQYGEIDNVGPVAGMSDPYRLAKHGPSPQRPTDLVAFSPPSPREDAALPAPGSPGVPPRLSPTCARLRQTPHRRSGRLCASFAADASLPTAHPCAVAADPSNGDPDANSSRPLPKDARR